MKCYKGNFIFTKEKDNFDIRKDAYILVDNGIIQGLYQILPEEFSQIKVVDFGHSLVIPGFTDIHVHGSQYNNMGLGYDMELMPWLEKYTFPEESKFKNREYAIKTYSNFLADIIRNGTTSCVVFATIHLEASKALFDLSMEKGIRAYIGKVNMDRNAPDFLLENSEQSIADTIEFIKYTSNKSDMVKPIITPRFIPTCSNQLLERLGELSNEYDVPIQSHLSENRNEISFVKELHPMDKSYVKSYDKYKLMNNKKTIMAHCVYIEDEEFSYLENDNFFVAHCPTSNMALSSGLAPIRNFLDRDINVGLGSDIAGGYTISMKECMVQALNTSNIYNIHVNSDFRQLSLSEVFYLATKGGGKFFGNVGSFEKDYHFDALVIDDEFKDFSLEERLSKFIYFGKTDDIKEIYISGKKIAV